MIFYKRKFLAKTLKNLESKGLISEEQRQKIVEAEALQELGVNYTLLLMFGVLFLALALVLLIAYNIKNFSRAGQTALLLTLLLIVHLGAFFTLPSVNSRIKRGIYSEMLSFLSLFVLLANIVIFAQIYHFSGDTALLFFFLALLAWLLSAILQGFFLFLQGYIFAAIWFGLRIIEDGNFCGVALFFIFIGFIVATFRDSKFLAFLNTLFIALYCFCIPASSLFSEVKMLLIFIAVIFLSTTSKTYSTLAYLMLAFALLFGSASGHLSLYEVLIGFKESGGFLRFLPIIGYIFLGILFVINIRFKRYFLAFLSFFILYHLLILFIPIAWKSQIICAWQDLVPFSFESILYSLLGLILGIYLIKQKRQILGGAVILILGFIRYVDFIDDYISASAIFAIFGLILLGVGFIKKRAAKISQNTAKRIENEG